MTAEEAGALAPGVYRVRWHDGTTAVAAVGRLLDGRPWLASARWMHRGPEDITAADERVWLFVERAELIAQ